MSHVMDAVSFLKGTHRKTCHHSFIPALVTVWDHEEARALSTLAHAYAVSTAATKVPDTAMGTCVPGFTALSMLAQGPVPAVSVLGTLPRSCS